MVVIEYRIVVPFTNEEFYRGLRYLDGRQRKEISSNSANGEQINTVEHRRFENILEVPKIIQEKGRIPNRGMLCRTGTFTENRIYLGTRFPGWMRALIPESAMYVREKYYNCYPYTFCSYHSELFPNGMDFTIESMHVENDIGENNNMFAEMTEKEKKEIKLQIVDITKPVESTAGVFQGDPTDFRCHATGRGPLPKSDDQPHPETKKKLYWFEKYRQEHLDMKLTKECYGEEEEAPTAKLSNAFWGRMKQVSQKQSSTKSNNKQQQQEPHPPPPHLCIYKRSKVEVYNIPFSSSIEEASQNSTVRDLAVHSFRNLFCWLPDWIHLSHDDISKYLLEVGGAV